MSSPSARRKPGPCCPPWEPSSRLGSWRSWWTAPRAGGRSPPSCPGPGREPGRHRRRGRLVRQRSQRGRISVRRSAGPGRATGRDLLGKICVPDLVCADLADAVTGSDDGAARLAELEASNLFVQSVGRAGRWYQLHRLVAELLRAQLTDPRQRRDLHRRAAEWHRTNGMPLEALRYALRGGSGARSGCGRGASDAVDGRRRRPPSTSSSAQPCRRWWAHPELVCGLAGARLIQGRGDGVGNLLAAARAGLADLPADACPTHRRALDLVESAYGRHRGDLPRVIASCRRVPEEIRALRSLGPVDWHMLRIVALGNLGTR